jgi:FMN-dependent NADH-azoreductase
MENPMNLLHIDSSPLGSHSVSRELTAAIVVAERRARPGLRVVHRDLARDPLPHWAPASTAGDPAARIGSDVLDEFLAADTIVIGAPMYNFSIPSQLKAWIDRIAIAGKTFRYGPSGPEGLAGGRRIVIASSRGGRYAEGPAAGMDFQESYLRAVFGFLGITEIEIVRAEGLNLGADAKAASIAAAHAAVHAGMQRAA